VGGGCRGAGGRPEINNPPPPPPQKKNGSDTYGTGYGRACRLDGLPARALH